MKTNVLAWHYTTGMHFLRIVESGVLYPATVGMTPPEKPILWFSLNQQFEPTARKCTFENGAMRTLSVQETFERGGGLVRFGISPHHLLSGEKLRHRAHVDRKLWAGLRLAGIKQQADPDLWFGSISALEVQKFTIEAMNDSGSWERVKSPAATEKKGGLK